MTRTGFTLIELIIVIAIIAILATTVILVLNPAVILAEAQKQSQIFKGEGDGQAVKIYADAFNKDKDFFAFYRSMEAYTKAFKEGDDDPTLILSPDSDFFKYFDSKSGK